MKNVTNSRRVLHTKRRLRKALTELLEQKPLQSITVRELCERAGINRGTFYMHYTDMYDLLQQLEDEMLTDFRKALEPLLRVKEKQLHPVELSTQIFQCLKDNADICVVTLGDYGDKDFALKLINLGRERCFQAYAQYFTDASPRQLDYFYAFVSAGCIGLLKKWLDEGMLTSAKDIALTAESLMLHGIGFLKGETQEMPALQERQKPL